MTMIDSRVKAFEAVEQFRPHGHVEWELLQDALAAARQIEDFLRGGPFVTQASTDEKDEAAVSLAQMEAEFPILTMGATNDKVLQFPEKEMMVAKDDPDAKPARRPRGPNKVRAASGKRRGRPAKAAKADTGDAPGDAPETAPVSNGAMPHVETAQQVEQPDMAA